jgi:NADP-dependent 3-hydroxy acid dehydrogenase YdfG
MNRLDGKFALFSGAALGIGGETAQLMTKAGARLVVGDVLHDAGYMNGAGHVVDGGVTAI